MASTAYTRNIYDDENRNPNSKPSKQSVLKSFIPSPSKIHRRNASRQDDLAAQRVKYTDEKKIVPLLPADHPHAVIGRGRGPERGQAAFNYNSGFQLPTDHPHTIQARRQEQLQQQPLGERELNRDADSGEYRRMIEEEKEKQAERSKSRGRGLHKKTKSVVSLRSLVGGGEKKEKEQRSPDDDNTDGKNQARDEKKMKKSKSSTSLSALLSKPRSSRSRKRGAAKDKDKEKENLTPPSSSGETVSPIWAQFATKPFQNQQGSFQAPGSRPGTGRSIEEEMRLYTPRDYSPSKQRNFGAYEQPTLSKRPVQRERPKSEYLVTSKSGGFFTEHISGDGGRKEAKLASPIKGDVPPPHGVGLKGDDRVKSRVMATVAKLNKDVENEKRLDPREIESAFEALLDSRNIPENRRDGMRSLDTHIKADFIRTDRADRSSSGNESGFWNSRPNTPGLIPSSPKKELTITPGRDDDSVAGEAKRPRPRSRTFTWSKGDKGDKDKFPTKKTKAENGPSHSRPKSIDVSGHASSQSLTSSSSVPGLAFLSRPAPITAPDDFVSYLRKVQKPEAVEVGKLHKLRLLLRNETVLWVDSFISKGGMDEVVSLLHRIIKVEWREEHEDTLLHETLLCLKALCTTSAALSLLSTIQVTLFPTLLNLLFSEEHKGPSEFTTRAIIMSLFFTYLSNGGLASELTSRTETLLSYLRDPTPPEEAKPLNFIAEIYTPRPYKLWCKELVNVTKEVFWIFLHHLNVIPLPSSDSSVSRTYTEAHFPHVRPPVPSAPYVGGVEWDATNYLATHLDLLNGLIASLPTREQRNALRIELRNSGFEKCMGGSLRTCKEKFYGAVHDGLGVWCGAAKEDGWAYRDVKEGPPRESPRKALTKGAPKLDVPKLDVKVNISGEKKGDGKGDSWL